MDDLMREGRIEILGALLYVEKVKGNSDNKKFLETEVGNLLQALKISIPDLKGARYIKVHEDGTIDVSNEHYEDSMIASYKHRDTKSIANLNSHDMVLTFIDTVWNSYRRPATIDESNAETLDFNQQISHLVLTGEVAVSGSGFVHLKDVEVAKKIQSKREEIQTREKMRINELFKDYK